MGTSKGSVALVSTLTWTTFHRSPLRSIKEPCSGTDLSPSMSRSISSLVGSPLYRNTICLPALILSLLDQCPRGFCSSETLPDRARLTPFWRQPRNLLGGQQWHGPCVGQTQRTRPEIGQPAL